MLHPVRFGSITINADRRIIQIDRDLKDALPKLTYSHGDWEHSGGADDVTGAEKDLYREPDNWALLRGLMRTIQIHLVRNFFSLNPEEAMEKKAKTFDVLQLLQCVIDTTPTRAIQVDEQLHRTFKSMTIGPIPNPLLDSNA